MDDRSKQMFNENEEEAGRRGYQQGGGRLFNNKVKIQTNTNELNVNDLKKEREFYKEQENEEDEENYMNMNDINHLCEINDFCGSNYNDIEVLYNYIQYLLREISQLKERAGMKETVAPNNNNYMFGGNVISPYNKKYFDYEDKEFKYLDDSFFDLGVEKILRDNGVVEEDISRIIKNGDIEDDLNISNSSNVAPEF